MQYHDFDTSLAMSQRASDLPFWEEVYRKAFPGLVAITRHDADGFWQREGIDRSIVLANSKQILVDEKVRFRNAKTGKVYEDIALEILSDRAAGKPGWVQKPLRADYIAYAIAPLGRCYLLPVLQLQQAWKRHGAEWQRDYRSVVALNRSHGREWHTISVAVPCSVVFQAIGACLRVQFTPCEAADSQQEAI